MKLKKQTLVICMLATILFFFGCKNVSKEYDVSVIELHELLQNEDVIVLDVRTPKEVAEGKIKSTALEADFFTENSLEAIISNISKDQDIYVYCKSGRRSGKTVAKLRALGFTKAHNIKGGITAWKAEGYEIE
ncbi:thiosulfate sulfurtransferase GlpE [Kordia sp. SMS9]|uniref:rhodanese-like domain-containing protein n=1 Tax=Kordia sp. SMS9 TaxID=2282170 RepID=UPI000E0D251D|nr:rhodanese-like domain-containing protein [Kordia sp. SMS9]AXG70114.1 thiosulfate sulfurtransferase GlpE [Kordia sp. SMS9]